MPIEDQGSAKSSNAEATPLDVVNEAIGPSSDEANAEQTQETGDATAAESHDPAQSSSAKDGEKPAKQPEEKDLLSVVRDAVEAKDKPTKDGEAEAKDPEEKDAKTGDASSASGKSESQEKPADGEEADPTPEELAAYKPKTRKQIEKLLTQRSELRGQLEDLTPQAEQYGKITSYMDEYGLTANDVAQAFAITAMFKHDPAKCREELVKRIELLDEQIGNKLSDDLKKKVDDGSLDEEAALELSRARAEAKRERELRTATVEHVTTEAQQRQAEAAKNNVKTAVTAWQKAKIEKDPDFPQKAVLLDKYVRAMVAEKGQPKTPKDALEMAEAAYEQVNKDIVVFRPAQQPAPKRVVQSRHVQGTPRPTPSNPLDVVKMALGGA